MDEDAIKNILLGGLRELTKDRKFFYHSSVSSDYSHFTPEGERALCDFMKQMSVALMVVDEAGLNRRAKDLVLKGLKGETL